MYAMGLPCEIDRMTHQTLNSNLALVLSAGLRYLDYVIPQL